MAGSPATATGLDLVCCPDRVQRPLACVLQLVWGRASSFTFATLRLALSFAIGKEVQSFPYPCHHMADEEGVSSVALIPSGLASLIPDNKVSSSVLPRWEPDAAFSCAITSEGQV